MACTTNDRSCQCYPSNAGEHCIKPLKRILKTRANYGRFMRGESVKHVSEAGLAQLQEIVSR